jgi:Transposase IS66 family
VAYPLTLIARLYRIEHLADALGVTPDGRVALREERSIPALERLQRWCVITQTNEPPSAALAKATAYLLNHWSALTRFVTDGRLDLDNNLTNAASGITNGMPPAGLCRVRPRGRRLHRETECVSLGQAA